MNLLRAIDMGRGAYSLGKRVCSASVHVRDKGREGIRASRFYVRTHPLGSLSLATGVGIGLGFLMSRIWSRR